MDMLYQLDQICRKYNIHYFASGGTMLGAVRHKGFIPWDDDIDIMMFREEYDKLCKVAPKELKYPYFFKQNIQIKAHCVVMRRFEIAKQLVF